MHRVILPLFLLLVTYANAQTLLPGRQVSVNPTNFVAIPTPDPETAQRTFELIDTSLSSLTGRVTTLETNVLPRLDDIEDLDLLPGTNITGAAYNTNTLSWDGLMLGTNIVGATYSNLQWTVESPEGRYLPGTNLAEFTYNTNTLTWSELPSVGGAVYFYASTNVPLSHDTSFFGTPGTPADAVVLLPNPYNPAAATRQAFGVFTNYAVSDLFKPSSDTSFAGGLWLAEPGTYLVDAAFGVTQSAYDLYPYTLYIEQRRGSRSSPSIARGQAVGLGGNNSGSSSYVYVAPGTNDHLYFSLTPVSTNFFIQWLSLSVTRISTGGF